MSRTSDILAPAARRLTVADRIVADYAPYALFAADPVDLLGGSTITGWRDRSGNGRHLTTVSGTAPVYTSSSNGFNGRPAVNFTAGYLETTATFALDDCSFLAVFADMGTTTTEETPIGTFYSTGFWLGRNSSNANKWTTGFIEAGAPYGQVVDATDGYGHAIATTRSGVTHTVYVDGASAASKGTGSAATLSATPFRIGGGAGGSTSPTSLHIALAAVWNRTLSASEVAAMQAMFRQAWGLS